MVMPIDEYELMAISEYQSIASIIAVSPSMITIESCPLIVLVETFDFESIGSGFDFNRFVMSFVVPLSFKYAIYVICPDKHRQYG